MDDLQTRFEAAAENVQDLDSRPDNATLLQLYGLYKQATVGDVEGKRPGFTNLGGRMKYDAWAELEGTAPDEAKQQYVNLVDELTA